jgi:hypothetical protein
VALLTTCLLAAGCGTQTPTSRAATQSATFNIPPKQLVQDVRRIVSSPPLSLGAQSVENGTILTGWREYRGELHIVRYWQERTRFRINVIPDWNDPNARSRLEVGDETEQRAETRQKWYPAPELNRPDRAADVLKQIESQLTQSPK